MSGIRTEDLELPGEIHEGLPGTSPEDDPGLDRRQRPMEVDPNKYYETGFTAVVRAQDGLPLIAGPPPLEPEPGLSDDNFVCSKSVRFVNGVAERPSCQHYGAVLVPAAGVSRGHKPMRQIRRFCKRLSTASELYELDGDVYACTMREPADSRSLAIIEDFEAQQKRMAEEAAETGGSLDF
jgi:hypothetical protein